MRWVGEVEEVTVERTEQVREIAVLRALESQMDGWKKRKVSGNRSGWHWSGWPAEKEGSSRGGSWHPEQALERARRLTEEARKPGLEVEDDQGGERPSRWRGMRRGRGGQMRFIVGDGDGAEEQDERGQDQARGEEGREPGPAAGGREDREEGGEGVEEGEVEGGGQESAVGDRVGEASKGEGTIEGNEREGGKRGREADEQDLQAEQQQEGEGDGRPRRKRARGVRYGEEQGGCEEQGVVPEGVTVYGPHKVSGKWRRYVGTVEEMIEQQDRRGHVTRAAIVQWEDQGEGDEERLPSPVERLQVCPRGREMEIHGQLVPEQEARELEGEEVSAGGKNKKRK